MVGSGDGVPRLGVLVSGRGSNLQALLEAEAAGTLGATVAVVLADQPEAPALERARRHGVHAEFVEVGSRRARLSAEAEGRFVARLEAAAVEWVVLAGFFRIVGATLLARFPDRVLNIHPSLLPAFPGLHAQRQALEHGVKVAGCTVHLVDGDVDAGPILAQRAVPVQDDDTEESLAARILEAEHAVLVATIARIARHGFVREGRRILWRGSQAGG